MTIVAPAKPQYKRTKNAKPFNVKPLTHLPINRNLMHWPIARGERATIYWKRSRDEVGELRWRYYKINSRVTLRLPLDCGFKRHATGFDFLVLMTLTALANARNCGKLRLTNLDILKHMGLRRHGSNRTKVAKAIEFWEHATLEWTNWRIPGMSGDLTIHRPLRRKPDGIVVIQKWRNITVASIGYFERLPVDLPVTAPVQNLILLLLAQIKRAKKSDIPSLDEHDGLTMRQFRSQREVTRLIGLESNYRNRHLMSVVEHAKKWFRKHGGALTWETNADGSVTAWFKAPYLEGEF